MIRTFLRLFTEKRHWYSVELVYQTKEGKRLGSVNIGYGVLRQNHIFRYRNIKKIFHSFIAEMPKNLLCNGVFNVNIIGYLGYFKKEDEKSMGAEMEIFLTSWFYFLGKTYGLDKH